MVIGSRGWGGRARQGSKVKLELGKGFISRAMEHLVCFGLFPL